MNTIPRTLIALAALSLARTLLAQSLIHEFIGGAEGGRAGHSVAILGDIDGDGRAETLVGLPDDDGEPDSRTPAPMVAPPFEDHERGFRRGRVLVISGTGQVVASLVGSANGDGFGYSVAAVGDVNGDASADFVVGAPFAKVGGTLAGQVQLISGKTFRPLRITNGTQGERLGWSVCHAGGGRYAAGAPYFDSGATQATGRVWILSSQGGLESWQTSSPQAAQANELFGWSVSGPTPGTTTQVVVIGCPSYDGPLGADQGRVFVRRGSTTSWRVEGQSAGARFGHAVAYMGDVNGDGESDVAVGAPFAYLGQTGAVFLVSGAGSNTNHANLWDATGTAGSRFGWSLARAGEWIAGRSGLIVGAPGSSGGAGQAFAYDATNRQRITTLSPPPSLGICEYGYAVAGGGDIVGDGSKNDILVGAPHAVVDGISKVGWASGIQLNRLTASVWISSTLWTLSGPLLGDRLGTSVTQLGDLNQDGISEFAIGSPHADVYFTKAGTTVPQCGRVQVFDGATGSELRQHRSITGGDDFGWSIVRCGKVDSDQVEDYAIGATQSGNGGSGYVEVFSGATGVSLGKLAGTVPGEAFGSALAGNADVSGDGIVDLLVGAPGSSTSSLGRVTVFSSAGWQVLNTITAPYSGRFGHSIAVIGDVTSDGVSEFLVGDPTTSEFQPLGGRAVVFRGSTWSPLYVKQPKWAGSNFGYSCAGVGDQNGDGVPDFAIGAPFLSDNGAFSTFLVGRISVYSGATGAAIYEVDGATQVLPSFHVGTAIASIEDVNADGRRDILVGGTNRSNATVDILTSGTSSHLHLELVSTPGTAIRVAALGDIDSDGGMDFAVGIPRWPPLGTTSRNRGRTAIFSLGN